MTPKNSIVLHLALTLVAAALVGGAAWAETQSRQRHAQLAQSLRELEAEVAQLTLAREAVQAEQALVEASRKAGLYYGDFSDRQLDISNRPMSRERINQVLRDNFSGQDSFFLAESFSVETGSVQDGLFSKVAAGSSAQPVLTLKGRQVFRK